MVEAGMSSSKRKSLRSCYLNEVRDAGFPPLKGTRIKAEMLRML